MKRALVEYIPDLNKYKDVVEHHIPHKYSNQAAKKSNVIPLGILQKDENITEQMIEIIEHLQQYVPTNDDGKMLPVLLGGDALSVERGKAAQRARTDAVTQADRLDGFEWKSEDWHGHIISLQESYNLLYKCSSSGEKGTLFQLRNLFDKRGVKLEVTNAVNECREFLRFSTKGFIILAAMEILELTKLEEFAAKTADLTIDEAHSFLEHMTQQIIDKFIKTNPIKLTDNGKKDDNRVRCGFPGCPKTFAINGRCRDKHWQMCVYKQINILNEPVDNRGSNNTKETVSKDFTKEDNKFNYTCNVLREGLMDWCREDASKENDGDRLIRLWRFDMLKFHLHNHTKYRLLAFNIQAQLMALLPPKLAFELKNNRCVNIHGGAGGNVPGDLALEFMNMRAKDALHSLHGNLTPAAIERCGRSLQGCNELIETYTAGLSQFWGKPSNSKPTLTKDIKLLVGTLCEERLFQNVPGRQHRSFATTPYNPLQNLNGNNLQKWLTEKKQEYSKTQRTRSYLL